MQCQGRCCQRSPARGRRRAAGCSRREAAEAAAASPRAPEMSGAAAAAGKRTRLGTLGHGHPSRGAWAAARCRCALPPRLGTAARAAAAVLWVRVRTSASTPSWRSRCALTHTFLSFWRWCERVPSIPIKSYSYQCAGPCSSARCRHSTSSVSTTPVHAYRSYYTSHAHCKLQRARARNGTCKQDAYCIC